MRDNQEALLEKIGEPSPDTPEKFESSKLSNSDSSVKSVYQDRIVAFVDILGFRNIVMNSSRHVSGRTIIPEAKEQDLDERIHSALQIAPSGYGDVFKKIHNISDKYFDELDLKISTFSDSVIMSSRDEVADFAYLLHSISFMTRELIRQGFLVRGGIAFGEVHHIDNASKEEFEVERVFCKYHSKSAVICRILK